MKQNLTEFEPKLSYEIVEGTAGSGKAILRIGINEIAVFYNSEFAPDINDPRWYLKGEPNKQGSLKVRIKAFLFSEGFIVGGDKDYDN